MRRLSGLMCCCALGLSLGGCGGGGGSATPAGSSATPDSINGIAVPADPGSSAKATVAGVDANANGVRDEVEREVAKLYGSDASTHAAATKYAKKLQASMLVANAATPPDVATAIRSDLAAMACLKADLGGDSAKTLSVDRDVRLLTLNSAARRAGVEKIEEMAAAADLSALDDTPCN